MTDQEIYNEIMSDELLQKYLEEDNYKRLYRNLKIKNSSIKFSELTAFLAAAGIDVVENGVVPVEAYKDNKSLISFDFSKITSIEASAFEGSGIKKVVLTKNQSVGQAAFKDSDVEEVYLKNGVELGPAAFARCKNLKELYISGGVKLSPLVFASCRNLEEVVFDDGREDWPDDLFANVKKIDYVTLPYPFRLQIFDFDISIDVLYLNCSRDEDVNVDNIKRLWTGIKEIEFLK